MSTWLLKIQTFSIEFAAVLSSAVKKNVNFENSWNLK